MPSATEKVKNATTANESKEKVLIYPTKLKDFINESDATSSASAVSFVMFTPLNEEILVPPLDEVTQVSTNKVENNDKSKSKIKYRETGIDAIILPIRPTEDSISANWQSVEGMGLGSFSRYFKWKMYKGLSGIASSILPQEAVFAMKSGAFGGGIDNPHDRLAFAGHNRRSFTIAWEFMKPQNKLDEAILNDIISIFRMSSVGGYGDWVITPPPTWRVEYYSLPDYPSFLRHRRCGIEASVNFGGEGSWHAMESGMPFMSLTLQVSNLDYDRPEDLWIRPSTVIAQGAEIERELTPEERQKQNAERRDQEKSLGGGSSTVGER